MGYRLEVNEIWKWITIDGSVKQEFYWIDFNPNPFSRPSSFQEIWTTWTTTSFNLWGFQPWHEVGCYVFRLIFDSTSSGTLRWEFLRYNSWRESAWAYTWNVNGETDFAWYMYFWVDDDEIRPWYTSYKVHLYGLNSVDEESPTFTISSLSFDDTLHSAWYLWVGWSSLCYTDCTWWELWNRNRWYKHMIAYDGNYSHFVWTEYSWMIWIDPNEARRIYYVDKYGYERRTYEANNWYGYSSWQWKYVSSDYKWKIRCPWNNDDMEHGYGHLCFVNNAWYVMRILNWPPSWIA